MSKSLFASTGLTGASKEALKAQTMLREALFPQRESRRPLDSSDILEIEKEARETLKEWPNSSSAKDANTILRLIATVRAMDDKKFRKTVLRRVLPS